MKEAFIGFLVFVLAICAVMFVTLLLGAIWRLLFKKEYMDDFESIFIDGFYGWATVIAVFCCYKLFHLLGTFILN